MDLGTTSNKSVARLSQRCFASCQPPPPAPSPSTSTLDAQAPGMYGTNPAAEYVSTLIVSRISLASVLREASPAFVRADS
ncbi:hypothetical protein MRX96_054416 [Rhipicephalus microplus]